MSTVLAQGCLGIGSRLKSSIDKDVTERRRYLISCPSWTGYTHRSEPFAFHFVVPSCQPSYIEHTRTFVYGASVGAESHGQCVSDCKFTPTGDLTKGKEGVELQERVWTQLKQKLEATLPSVPSLSRSRCGFVLTPATNRCG